MSSAFLLDQPAVPSVDAFSQVTHSSSTNHYLHNREASSSSLQVSSAFSDDFAHGDNSEHHHENSRRRTEFTDLGSIEESSERQRRIQQEERNVQRFVKYGDELWNLRRAINKLSRRLLKAISHGLDDEEQEIRQELRHAEQQDPELVYKLEMEQLKKAQMEGRESDAERHSRNAYAARSCLPQYNLDGLWVGK